MRCWGWRGLSISAHPQHTYNPTTEGTVTDIPAMKGLELDEALTHLGRSAFNDQVTSVAEANRALAKVAVAKASVLSAVSFLIVIVSLLGAAAGIFAMVRYW